MKQLLTALLIAGISATAKAEPVVYYCEWVNGNEILLDGRNIPTKGGRFTMAIDGTAVSISQKRGEGKSKKTYSLDSPYDPALGRFSAYEVFTSYATSATSLTFQDMVFTYSVSLSNIGISSKIARCEDF